MGSLLLVRHGQASFLSDDYDKLSPIGEEQSRRLGAAWARRGVRLDGAFVGPRLRQRRTCELVLAALAEAGLPAPEPVELPALDEMQAQLLLSRTMPDLVAHDSRLRALVEKFHAAAAGGASDPRRDFQEMFEVVMTEWVAGRLVAPEVESWTAFGARVRQALALMTAGESRGRRVAAFTSGGPIAVAMQQALQLPDAATLGVTFTARNAGVSEFVFQTRQTTQTRQTARTTPTAPAAGPDLRFSLSLYNEVSHLGDEARLLTYR